jgi:hypothetical protein
VTAAAAEVQITSERIRRLEFPLAFSTKVYKGASAMGVPAGTNAGQVRDARTGASNAGSTDLALGVFAETIDNSANTNTTLPVTVDFLKEKTILWRANDGSITSANLFATCYYADNQTVSTTSTNAPKAGTILAVDAILGVAFEVEGV